MLTRNDAGAEIPEKCVPSDNDPATNAWHIDRRIPVALIVTICLTILAQSGTALWWAATTSGRISTVEAVVNGGLTSRLNRIEDKLDRLMESRPGIRDSQ